MRTERGASKRALSARTTRPSLQGRETLPGQGEGWALLRVRWPHRPGWKRVAWPRTWKTETGSVRCGKAGTFVCSAAVTKYRRAGGSNNGHLVFRSSEDWQCKFKMPAGLASGEGSLLNLQTATPSPGPHVAFPLCSYLLSLPLIRTLIPP